MGYTHLKHCQPFVNYSQILAMVSGEDDREGRKRYGEFVIAGVGKDINIWEEVRGQAVLGSEGFVEWAYGRFLSKKKADKREIPGIKELQTAPSTMEEIAQEVAKVFDVDEGELYQRRSACRVAPSVFMELCCMYLARKMSLAEIGRRLGGVSVAALSHNSKRLAAKLEDDRHLRRCYQKWLKVGSIGD